MASARGPNIIARMWEWLGWRSRKVAEHRRETRGARENAELKLAVTLERARTTNEMSDWLFNRSKENHIAEALSAALSQPRRRA
jgi:hypothetical protein